MVGVADGDRFRVFISVEIAGLVYGRRSGRADRREVPALRYVIKYASLVVCFQLRETLGGHGLAPQVSIDDPVAAVVESPSQEHPVVIA